MCLPLPLRCSLSRNAFLGFSALVLSGAERCLSTFANEIGVCLATRGPPSSRMYRHSILVMFHVDMSKLVCNDEPLRIQTWRLSRKHTATTCARLSDVPQLSLACKEREDVLFLMRIRLLHILLVNGHHGRSIYCWLPLTHDFYVSSWSTIVMAEIFAVASGASLISLAMRLLQSSQKLKILYNAGKPASQTVMDLSFELETMSLALRQLAFHRRTDTSNDTLLGPCVMTCTLMTAKIEATVDKMERHLLKSRGTARMSSAFKEPEISKLMESLEHSKSSMMFAYVSYCR